MLGRGQRSKSHGGIQPDDDCLWSSVDVSCLWSAGRERRLMIVVEAAYDFGPKKTLKRTIRTVWRNFRIKDFIAKLMERRQNRSMN